MILANPLPLILLSLLLAVAGYLALGRGARATEGKIVSLLLPLLLLMSAAALQAKRGEMSADHRINLNDPHLDSLTLSEKAEIAPDLARRILDYRDRLPGRVFRSVGQIPSLGRASKTEVRQIQEWAKEKRWPELLQVVRTGRLPSEKQGTKATGDSEGEEDQSHGEESDETAGPPLLPPVVGRGLYPALDLQVRAAAALPHPPFTLEGSSRSGLVASLGEPGVAERVVQCRTLEDQPLRSLSDVSSVPYDRVLLRTPQEAGRIFLATMASLLFLFLAGHFYLRGSSPQADNLLWPLFSGLSIFGVLMLFAVTSPLTARANVWPVLGALPEYAGQGIFIAAAMLILPFSRSLLRFTEKVGSRWLAGLLGAAILLPNVLAGLGWIAVAVLSLLVSGLVWYGLSIGDPRFRLRAFDAQPPVPNATETLLSDEGEMASETIAPAADSRLKPVFATLLIVLAATVALTLARFMGGKTGYAPLVELSKILLVLFTARLCSDYEFFLGEGLGDLPARSRWELFGCWAAAMILAFLSDDLGFLLLLWIPFTLLLSLSIGRRWPAAAGLIGLLGGSVVLALSGHTRFPERVAAWIDPWSGPSTQMAEVFQRMASVPSVLAGTGIGHGAKLTISTDARDVILPLYYESLGWTGLALILGLLLLGLHRIFRVGIRARDSYAHWISLGFGCIFGVQTVYMIGAGFGAWPLTGMTLAPLASGKAAAFFTLAMAILVLAASGTPMRDSTPDRRVRARFVSGAFAVFAGLTLYSTAKLAKTAVLDKYATAIRPVGGAANRRAVAELASLKTGRILARKTGLDYKPGNLTSLAISETGPDGEERRRYPLGSPSFPVTGVMTEGHRNGGEDEWRSRLTGLDAFYDRARPDLPVDTPKDALLLDLWQRKRHPLWPQQDKIVPQDVQTTLNADMERWAYDALKRHLQNTRAASGARTRKGAMLIADVRTGEVLAYVQYPSPNPEALAESWEAWDALSRDPAGYLDPQGNVVDLVRRTDRAPGSTAKINTMMALADNGLGDRRFVCKPGIRVNGYEIRDHDNGVHGVVGIREILKYSCNRGAAQAAQAIGPDALLAQYRKLRYPLPHMPQPQKAFRQNYEMIAFGQAMSASLWDMATSVAAVARGGEAVELHLLKKPSEMVEKWRVCSKEAAARVADGMKAVTEPGGTAWSVYRGRHDWPSKTGSAEVAGQRDTDAWFLGFAPRKSPALAFVMWAEDDGTGSGLAQSLQLSTLIERDLKSIGIVDEPLTPRSRPRARRVAPAPQPSGPLEELLQRPELQKGRQFIQNLQDRFNRAREGFNEIRQGIRQLRQLKR
jgi:cell division protein FtsW